MSLTAGRWIHGTCHIPVLNAPPPYFRAPQPLPSITPPDPNLKIVENGKKFAILSPPTKHTAATFFAFITLPNRYVAFQ